MFPDLPIDPPDGCDLPRQCKGCTFKGTGNCPEYDEDEGGDNEC